MSQPENRFPLAITPCAQCGKELPLSETQVAEAVDDVVYFCGLQCYAKWPAQAEITDLPLSKADEATVNLTLTEASGNVAANELKSKHSAAALDVALTQSFPASDPIPIYFCAVASNASQHATAVTTPKPKRREIPSSLAHNAINAIQGNRS
ncbi:hypothetical protein CSZ94_04925 [Janthinobacterium sp. ROICE36]|uniref:DUF3330 domain-containing protein n=1 Tax=Janthinobacterium sp. ROICE36 TaxID=2048670 RepID=UPI000CC729EC|nr:DUF3330 domain-containing protein [Janthinobacterium sp. ROICE36]PLY45386.1 hypothetical protein CSZ94_04925 [Janthinobacterium sp. ROICE36]